MIENKDIDQSRRARNGLTDIMETLCQEIDDGHIKVEDVLDALGYRGFGPLLIAPSFITILPTGAIPFVPALCGLFVFAISVQIFIGKKNPWLPKKIKHISIEAQRFQDVSNRLKPYTQKIDYYVENRFAVLADNDLSKRFVALTSMVLSFLVIIIGFIPMLPAVLLFPILFFGLGLSVKDGLLMVLGYGLVLLAVFITPLLLA